MKTKIVPLALLLPVVVLAQPAYQAPAPQPPQVGIPQNPQPNPSNAASASAALSNAKKQAKELQDNLPSNGLVGSSSSSSVAL